MKLDDEYQRLAAAASDRVAKILENEGAQAKALFTRITERHGLGTAKLLFERCIKLAKEPSTEEEQEQRAAEKAKAKAAQRVRAMTNLPTVEKVAVADRRQLCIWWYRLPARKFSTRERCACYSRGQSFSNDQTERPPSGGLSVPSDVGKSSYHALLGVCKMDSLGVALVVGGMAFLISGLIFLIPIERKLSSSQETVEESLERLEHHLDEMGRERGEP